MIEGRLIALGPLVPNDLEPLFRWSNDPALARLNEPYRPLDWQGQHDFWMNPGKHPSMVVFAIRKREGRPHFTPIIGYVQITGIDPVHRAAMIGIRIGDQADRNQGFGSEALSLAIDFCWNHLNLSRLGLTVFKTNDGALRLYRRLGFHREGVLRRAVFIDGAWVDVVMMAKMLPSRHNARRRAG